MAEQEDPEPTSSHGHMEITTLHRATIDENDLKSSRKKPTTKGIKKTGKFLFSTWSTAVMT